MYSLPPVLWYCGQIIRYFGKHGLQRFERPALHNPILRTELHAIQIALLFTTSVGVRGLTLHLCNLDCKDWSQQMLKIDLDVVATKSCKKGFLVGAFVLSWMFICFLIAFIICGFPTVGIDLCLECYAPARLTRVIAQVKIGWHAIKLTVNRLSMTSRSC